MADGIKYGLDIVCKGPNWAAHGLTASRSSSLNGSLGIANIFGPAAHWLMGGNCAKKPRTAPGWFTVALPPPFVSKHREAPLILLALAPLSALCERLERDAFVSESAQARGHSHSARQRSWPPVHGNRGTCSRRSKLQSLSWLWSGFCRPSVCFCIRF